jgi:excinuclease UvrABC ATPase subunit
MQQEFIEIQGARDNNLKDISLRIPKRKITIFTGVSGSGKSSIVFDTIGSEAQRQLNETFSAFVRTFLPRAPRPDADVIENLSTAIIVDQKRLGGNSRSTVGTITDINPILRLLFSRIGKPYVGPGFHFSFNDPYGMCPKCEGLGQIIELDLDKVLDKTKSLNDGAILFPGFTVGSWQWGIYANSTLFDNDKPIQDYSADELQKFLHGHELKLKYQTPGGVIESSYEGLVEKLTRQHIKRDNSQQSENTRNNVARFLTSVQCPDCGGKRLKRESLDCRINGLSIADYWAMEVSDLIREIEPITDEIVAPVVKSALEHLRNLDDIGLGYLSLDRETTTLSGGESQRIKMVRHLSSSLVDLLYIFDEPSIGLHPRDVHRLNDLLRKLRDKGNTVLVVEHDRDVIEIADEIVDVGPQAGTRGGEIVYQGDVAGLLQADTLTGRFMQRKMPIKPSFRTPTGSIRVANVTLHNLKNVTVDIPTGVMTAITGVAGSGKSTLIHYAFLSQHPDAIVVDQSSISTNIRSNMATYTGILDTIRQLFAKANGVKPGLFSANSDGACPNCQGLGFIYTDLSFLEPIRTPCEICEGKRFKDEVLALTLNGKSINDVFNMTTVEALGFFQTAKLRHQLQTIVDVGLDYLTLGQPLSTLSGGECQRVKLASELHRNGNIYVLDEPTTGLHMSDVGHLLKIMDRLVDGGNTLIVIEHNLDVVCNADWVIDMGPEGGHRGGQVIFEGTPAALAADPHSLTGAALRQHPQLA